MGSIFPSRERSRAYSKLRVLLIDDEEMVRRCTARVLADFDVVTAGSAAEALDILRKDRAFSAILSDVMMPGMKGPDLYALCYRNFPELAPRFVFASGNPEGARQLLRQAIESVGAEHAPILLAKPASREALMLAIFAAAAHTAPRSGTYSALDAPIVEVTKYRG